MPKPGIRFCGWCPGLALPYKQEMEAAWKASLYSGLPFQRMLGKNLTTIRVPKDCGLDNEDAIRAMEAANQLIQSLRKAARENFAIHPAAANPASASLASPAAGVEKSAPLTLPAAAGGCEGNSGTSQLSQAKSRAKRARPSGSIESERKSRKAKADAQQYVRALLSDLPSDDAEKIEFQFEYETKACHPACFQQFYVNDLRSRGREKECPSTREEANTIWLSVVTNYAKKFRNAPPVPMIAAYLAQTQNASVKRCTEFLFSEHRDWAAHKDNVLAQGDVDYNRSRDYCQYLAWKEAHAYAKEMGKSDEDAANAGRQSIHAASTENELRSFRNGEGRRNWAQRIRDRMDAEAEAAASAAASAATRQDEGVKDKRDDDGTGGGNNHGAGDGAGGGNKLGGGDVDEESSENDGAGCSENGAYDAAEAEVSL